MRSPRVVRSGISLMEVLISIFILSIGLLGVAALIPIGKLAMIETGKSDRTGACGRAALRDIKVRRMLDYRAWLPVVLDTATPTTAWAIDPLGYAYYQSLTPPQNPNLGGASSTIPRYSLKSPVSGNALNSTEADLIFRWRDDLTFMLPRDVKTGTPPVGDRPFAILDASNNIQSDGNCSWFLTVVPVASELNLTMAQKQLYNVSVVVCYKRAFGDERFAAVTFPTGTAVSPGGGTIQIACNSADTAPLAVKENEWILIYSTASGQYSWYRAVSSITLVPNTSGWLSLVGPDWCGGANPKAVVIPGVTGVYTTTVRLDYDSIWMK